MNAIEHDRSSLRVIGYGSVYIKGKKVDPTTVSLKAQIGAIQEYCGSRGYNWNPNTNLIVEQTIRTTGEMRKTAARFRDRPGVHHILAHASPGDHVVIGTSRAFISVLDMRASMNLLASRHLTLAIADMQFVDTLLIKESSQHVDAMIRFVGAPQPRPPGHRIHSAPWGYIFNKSNDLLPMKSERRIADIIDAALQEHDGNWARVGFFVESHKFTLKVRLGRMSTYRMLGLWTARALGYPEISPEQLKTLGFLEIAKETSSPQALREHFEAMKQSINKPRPNKNEAFFNPVKHNDSEYELAEYDRETDDIHYEADEERRRGKFSE